MPHAPDIYLLDGARTPIGSFLGGLAGVSATELGVVAAQAALERAGVPADHIEAVAFGNVIQSAPDAPYLARHIGLRAGVPAAAPGLTLNRACGSGLEAALHAARLIRLGEARCVLAGGAENMSAVPYALRGARQGWKLARQQVDDVLISALHDPLAGCSIGETVEHLAAAQGIDRAAADAAAVEAQARAHAAASHLAREITPVPRGRKPPATQDEAPRPGTPRETLAALPGLFAKDGVITAGNSCGLNDGAAALVVAHADFATAHGLRPLGRLRAWRVTGIAPRDMALGPIAASQGALADAGLAVADLDLIELNDSFTVQSIAVQRALALDPVRVNPSGGALALGHPMGATGARLLLTALYQLRRTGGRFALCTLCVGGGQGVAAVIEAVDP